MKNTIYLAGGCFWGVQAYMKKLPGILETEAGYANGNTVNPSYEEVCKKNTGHAETVRVVYEEETISLEIILCAFFKVVDPTQLNRQGGDVGTQYRNGVFYEREEDRSVIENVVERLRESYREPVVTEIKRLENFYPAEAYHQDYLDKNPGGYCHINLFDAEAFIEEYFH
jgi:peptide methionine sulfoxide reductase msrA/msrB